MGRNLRLWVIAAGVLSLALWTGGSAFAADGDAVAAEAAPDPATFEATLQGLTLEEQEAMRQAYSEVSAGQISGAREVTGPEGRQTNPALGAPEGYLGGTVGGEGYVGGHVPTAEEQKMMQEADARRKELETQGLNPDAIDKRIRDEFEQKYGWERSTMEDMPIPPWDSVQEGGTYGEGKGHSYDKLKELYQEGRPVGEAIQPEMTERYGSEHGYDAPTVEHFGSESTERSFGGRESNTESYRETEHYTPESQQRETESYTPEAREAIERPMMDYEAPERYTPEVEPVERETHEAPEPMTAESREMPEYTGGGMQY